MSSYSVQAKRWERGWELYIYDPDGAEVGVTQSHTIRGADRMVRDYVALLRDEDPHSLALDIRPVLDAATTAKVERARQAVRAAEQAQLDAARESREVARRLIASGLTGGDVAAVLGVSAQRVSQLVKAP